MFNWLLAGFTADQRGNFAVMTALLLSGISLTGLMAADVYDKSEKSALFSDQIEKVCLRTNRLSHSQVPEDSKRMEIANAMLDKVMSGGPFTLKSKSVKVNWLDVTVSATATFKPMSNFIYSGPIEVTASHNCGGIPPYPRDGTKPLTTDFNEDLTLTRMTGRRSDPAAGCWDILTVDDLNWGWSESRSYSRGGNILELDSNGEPLPGEFEILYLGENNACFSSGIPSLPSKSTSYYVIELDVYNNNEISHVFPMHPGRYSVRMFYFGRHKTISYDASGMSSNAVAVYLEAVKPTGIYPRNRLLLGNSEATPEFLTLVKEFDIREYGIYRLTIKSEGASDSIGGVFNSFSLTYHDDTQGSSAFAAQ